MKAIVLVHNPAIYMHSLEAMHHLEIQTEDAILVVTAVVGRNVAMLRNQIDPSEWKYVHFPTVSVNPNLTEQGNSEGKLTRWIRKAYYLKAYLRRMEELGHSYLDTEVLISGFYSHELTLQFSSTIDFKRYVLVDDGNLTKATAAGRDAERRDGFRHVLGVNSSNTYSGILGKIKLIYLRLLGVKDSGIRAVTFFTSQNICADAEDTVIRNEYKRIKAAKQSPVQRNVVWLLGAPIIETGLLSNSSYSALLDEINNYYSGRVIKYFPHRFENRGIDVVRQRLPGAQIVQHDRPIEEYIAEASFLPGEVASYYSSALINLLALLNPEVGIRAFVVPESYILDSRRLPLIREIYRSFRARADAGEAIQITDLIKQ